MVIYNRIKENKDIPFDYICSESLKLGLLEKVGIVEGTSCLLPVI